ncbi:hypothetical protein G6F16_002819 [Rhizopus arrhizus]|uniref:Pep3/Vps18 RING C-terminal domain-containing protein n=1 Tax=Rhizopus oryzae TaxID=64495 RepID=A0A9P6X9C6_RHIOR|nr:hypothetical protein G6F24_001399 [Rhizopus arrhizus]KAG0789785.1 hypothetical protein G6F21_006269 [Rhizopus arrhizus]KAG0801031.1 hypothetical protein G6F22_001643 [Rhizopus arrhizus]KAG0811512.1 hypothetical protein G6F20_007105 [Rhizopus arrhizus]KAG0832078.1 hypothetical protein G6F18_007384 [Rhizopus arrhizus]
MSLFDDFLESTQSTSAETRPIPIPQNNRKKASVEDEESHVWKSHLQQKNYEAAIQSCKSPAQQAQVYAAQAQDEFERGRYTTSAQCFAKSNVPFDQVVLKFTRVKEKDALRYYLIHRLERLGPNDRTQKTLVATWLVESYLSRMDQLDDKSASIRGTSGTSHRSFKYFTEEQQSIRDEFKTFLETYGALLHAPTTYKLIAKHGRNSELIYYASYIGDSEKMIDHWIDEKNWEKALDLLKEQDQLDLIYKYSTLLIDHVPVELVNLWLDRPGLNPRYLIPALLRYHHSNSILENQAIRYLSHVVTDLGNTDSIIHNLLLSLYAAQPNQDETPLLTFLKNEGRDMHYELDHALRVCSEHKRTRSCVHIYGQMGLYEEAVRLALEHKDLDLARVYADKPEEDDVLRKKLWTNIAKYVIESSEDIKNAIQLLMGCDLLKIEDILPFFPNHVLIDNFKEEICASLEEYNVSIEELKSEMDNATVCADHIRLDVKKLKKKFAVVEEEQACSLCQFPLLTRQFYVFPCHHVFHADCLINRVTKHLPTRQIRKLADIQEQLSREFKLARTRTQEEEEDLEIFKRIESLRHQLDDIVADQCVVCGDILIHSIHVPFITEEEAEIASSWII